MAKEKRSSLMRFLFSYAKYAKRAVLAAILVGVITGASSAALMALISARVAGAHVSTLFFATWFCGLVTAVLLTGFLSRMLSVYLSQRTSFELQVNLCRQILAAPLRHLEELGPHRILAVLTDDVSTITAALLNIPQLCVNVAMVVGCLIYLGLLSWTLLAFVLVFLVMAISGYVALNRRATEVISCGAG